MRFAEVFLRLGTSLVAWMMLYAHILWLAATNAIGCGPDADEMQRLLLGLAPLTCGFAFLLRMTRPFNEIHGMLRWLGAPLALLLPFALFSIWVVFEDVNLDSSSICSSDVPASWQQLWAPIQVITVCLVTYLVIQVWCTARLDARDRAGEIEQSN